jgi:hypothetical protein
MSIRMVVDGSVRFVRQLLHIHRAPVSQYATKNVRIVAADETRDRRLGYVFGEEPAIDMFCIVSGD